MPLRTIAGTDLQYYLTLFDEDGRERRELDGTRTSDALCKLLADPSEAITDVFFVSHGWKGDVAAAVEQYDRWIAEMGASTADIAALREIRPGFKALVVGLHWPSLSGGDESMPKPGGLLSAGSDGDIDADVDRIAASISTAPEARDAIRQILEAADREDSMGGEIPPYLKDAYDRLYAASGLASAHGDGTLSDDHDVFDANAIIQESRGEGAPVSGTPGLLGPLDSLRDAILMPIRQISFWQMKNRARQFGETGGHDVLVRFQECAPATTHFHLMGHSFGCIVVSATIAGGNDAAPLVRPVDSLFLVQGALSLWSYCSEIPYDTEKAGYFNNIVKDGLVRGPIVTTRSSFDKAVRKLYPKAAGLKKQFVLDSIPFPKYGGVGTFGLQGLDAVGTQDIDGMYPQSQPYRFECGRIYNVESSKIIKTGGGFSGAHSDIAHPEVAHAMWQAIVAAS